MAVFHALTLFCVLQLVLFLPSNAAPFDIRSYQHHLKLREKFGPDNSGSENRNQRRSLNYKPFELKYLGTESHTLEIMPNGTVVASQILRPTYGALKFSSACTEVAGPANVGDMDRHLEKTSKFYGHVSIRGEKSEKYICMNGEGQVYGSSNCTAECEFKEQSTKEGGSTHNIYYSLLHRGFPDQPKRLKKKWYLGINRRTGKVLIGHKAKKRSKAIKFIRRPVQETSGPDDGYGLNQPTQPTVIEPAGESDEHGSVSVGTTSPRPQKRRRNCRIRDPLDLFRPEICSNENRRQSSSERNSSPFSRTGLNHRRHQKHNKQRMASRDVNINLFVISNNDKNNDDTAAEST